MPVIRFKYHFTVFERVSKRVVNTAWTRASTYGAARATEPNAALPNCPDIPFAIFLKEFPRSKFENIVDGTEFREPSKRRVVSQRD